MTRREFTVNESGLTQALDELEIGESKIAIVGGHYLLLYEMKTDSLKPAIHQEFEDWGNKTFSRRIAQDFPVRSFELAAHLHVHFKAQDVDSRCVLLVNDDSFTRKDFRNEAHYNLIQGKGFQLRKKYFNTVHNLPAIYQKILDRLKLKINDFFATFDDSHPTDDSLMPPETIFVSERRLCRNFKKTVKTATASDQLFKILNIDHVNDDSITELTVESGRARSVCLIEKGVCNCGGKAFQFYFDLIQKGFETIIFFVPEECRAQVNEGTNLICSSRKVNEKTIRIITISNLDVEPDLPIEKNELIVNFCTNKSKLERQRV